MKIAEYFLSAMRIAVTRSFSSTPSCSSDEAELAGKRFKTLLWSLSKTAQSMKQAWRSWIVGSCIMLLPVACTLAVKMDGDGSLSMVSGMQWTRAMFSLPALCCMLPIVVGYVWMTTFSHLDTYDQMCCIWLLLNAFWFHLGCDVLSGLFGIMPNLAEAYLVADRRHNTERRVEMDAMYWCELFIHSPLCALVFWSYCTRQPHTKLLEAIVQAISFTGTIAYYGPEMLSGWPNTVVAPARYAWLGLGAVWIVVPFIIMLQTCKGITSTGVLTEHPPQTTAASRVFTGAQTVTTIQLKQTKDASSATKAHDIGTFSKVVFGLAMEPSVILSGAGLIMFWLLPQIVPVASPPVPPPPPPAQWWAKAGAFFCK